MPALLTGIFIKTTQLRTSWKAMRPQWRQLIWQKNSLFCKYLLILSILLTQSQWDGKDVACGQNGNADAAWTGMLSNFAKAIMCVYENEINGGQFEHLMW